MLDRRRMREIDVRLTECVATIADARTRDVTTVVIAEVPLIPAWPQSHRDVEGGAFDSALLACPRTAVRVKERHAVWAANHDVVAVLVLLQNSLGLCESAAVV